MKKILILISLILGFGFSLSYKVDLPEQTNDIQSAKGGSIDTSHNSNYYQSLAKTINTYLWFIFGSVALAMVVYGGILLISSNGDPADLKKANKILIWGLVGIFVSLLAYLIIKLLINLF